MGHLASGHLAAPRKKEKKKKVYVLGNYVRAS